MSIRQLTAVTIALLIISALVGYNMLAGVINPTYFLLGGIGYLGTAVAVGVWGFGEKAYEQLITAIAILAVALAVLWLVLASVLS